MSDMIDIVFDRYPSPNGPMFIEVEVNCNSVSFGEWRDIREPYKALSFPNPRSAMESAVFRLSEIYDPSDDVLERIISDLRDMIELFPATSTKS